MVIAIILITFLSYKLFGKSSDRICSFVGKFASLAKKLGRVSQIE